MIVIQTSEDISSVALDDVQFSEESDSGKRFYYNETYPILPYPNLGYSFPNVN